MHSASAREFTEAVSSRYAHWLSHWPWLTPVFLQQRAGGAVNSYFRRYHINLQPHLVLTALNRTVEDGLKRPRSASWHKLEARIQLVHCPQRDVLELLPMQRLTRRLFLRGERIEESPVVAQTARRKLALPGPDRDRVENASTKALEPARRVFRRTLPVQQESESASHARNKISQGSRIDNWLPGIARRHSDAPIDVHKITEHVIHEIDRRIVAQRERMGRA